MSTSTSEERGLALLDESHRSVYSVGISTAGNAEIRMVRADQHRHVTATTVDERGFVIARDAVLQEGLQARIDVRMEDVADPLPHPDATFDFIYARLVLHYLTAQQLDRALPELHRVLRTGGRLFVVVRSTACTDAHKPGITHDPNTRLTTYPEIDPADGVERHYSRYFHSIESITGHLGDAGFSVGSVEEYDETLYTDFERSRLPSVNQLIEIVATR